MATITQTLFMRNPKEHGNGRSTPAVPLKNAARPRTAAEIQRTTEKTRRDREKRLQSIRKRRNQLAQRYNKLSNDMIRLRMDIENLDNAIAVEVSLGEMGE
jgi:hypothetical protein